MRYKNIKTGAILDSPFNIFGDNWELVSSQEVSEEVETEQYTEEEINLSEMTKAELIELATENEIKVNDKDNKAVIIETIAKAFE